MSDGISLEDMSREGLLKLVNRLQTTINLQKAKINDMPGGVTIGYALMAMSVLGFSEKDMSSMRQVMYGLLKEKTQREAEDFYNNCK